MKTNSIILLPVLVSILSSCGSTKGPREVTARPFVIPQRQSATEWAKDSAPRTQPGKVMDPDAVTYAQVPKRILFLPGEHGIFGRKSAQQEVAYDLVPVDRIPEVQAQGTPSFQPNYNNAAKWTAATFADPEGNLRKGKARRLGVTNQTVRERNRAESLLEKSETLEWLEGTGWVGFTETDIIQINKNPTPLEPPPAVEPLDVPEKVEPKIEAPTKIPTNPKVEKKKDGAWGLEDPIQDLDVDY